MKWKILLAFGITLILTACTMSDTSLDKSTSAQKDVSQAGEVLTATFAGGCFWCMEPAYQEHEGIIDAVVGYAGGSAEDATYKKVTTQKTAHREAVQVTYDSSKVTYGELIDIYWRQIDPTDTGGQFADRGNQYTTAIYYHNSSQKKIAERSITELEKREKFDQPVATKLLPFETFFPAEEYHQDFYKKSSEYYKKYKKGSGRTDFIEENWAREAALIFSDETPERDDYVYTDEEIEEMRENLDPLSYHVVVEGGTESPFENAYWNNKADGIYVDKVTGEALFSSTHKYDSGTGWPSFHTTIQEDAISYHEDKSLGVMRTEIKSAVGGSHLGHIFPDGPEEEGGQRFCTNSASLEFIPQEEMEERGYSEFLYLFE